MKTVRSSLTGRGLSHPTVPYVLSLCVLVLANAIPAFGGAGSLVENMDGDGDLTIYVHFEYPPSATQFADTKNSLIMANEMICDATDGQVAVERFVLTGGQSGREEADLRLLQDRCRSSAPLLGLGVLGQASTICINGARPSTIAHELGHLIFGLGEQYAEVDRDRIFNEETGEWSRCDIGPGFEPDALDERNHTLMQFDTPPRCQGGTEDGAICLHDADCGGGECRPVLMSEFSAPINHDPVRGEADGVCPPHIPTGQISVRTSSTLGRSGPIAVFDSSSLSAALQTAQMSMFAELIDSAGSADAPQLYFFLTREAPIHPAQDNFLLVAAMREGQFDDLTWNQIRVLESWRLDFSSGDPVILEGSSPPRVRVEGLFSGVDAMDIEIDLSRLIALPFEVPEPNLILTADGKRSCGAEDCALRWHAPSETWAAASQSLKTYRETGQVESDWETIHRHYPFIELPDGLPTEAPPQRCLEMPEFVEEIKFNDQVLLLLDRSASMKHPANGSLDVEVCQNNQDDDEDGLIDESQCEESRLAFVKAAARTLLDLQIPQEMELGILQFNHNRRLVAPLLDLDETNAEGHLDAISSLSARGRTAIGDAVGRALEVFQQPENANRRQSVVLMTDGENNEGPEPQTLIPALLEAGIQVFTVPTGEAADQEGMSEMAALTGGTMYAADFESLPAIYAELAARLSGHATVLPRQRFLVSQKPWNHVTDPGDPKPKEIETLDLWVEEGAEALVVFLGGQNANQDSWKIDWSLKGPNGEFLSSDAPTVTVDPFYETVRLTDPAPGSWRLEVWSLNADLQRCEVTAHIEHPTIAFFADARPRQASFTQPVELSAAPSVLVPIEGELTLSGWVRRPDGSEVQVNLTYDPDRERWANDFDGFVGRGTYDVRLDLDAGSQARPRAGESLFDGPERLEIDVPPFKRSARTSFVIIDGPFPTCKTDDCDGDGIPNKYECGTDTDNDGRPNMWDLDSDSDDAPDQEEGLLDLNGNGVPDACDPTFPTLVD